MSVTSQKQKAIFKSWMKSLCRAGEITGVDVEDADATIVRREPTHRNDLREDFFGVDIGKTIILYVKCKVREVRCHCSVPKFTVILQNHFVP